MKIANWDQWQTFRKDRGTPPWIKVYRNLMSNEEWVSLSDSEKGQLVSLWILGADRGGTIPDNASSLKRMCMLDSEPNLNKFIALGFLVTDCQPSGNQVVTSPPEVDAPEESRVETEESRGKETLPDKPGDVADIFLHWQTVFCHTRSKLDDKRKRIIKAAIKSGYSAEDIKRAIDGCSVTPHNIGKNDRGQRYDGLHIILDSKNIDRFIGNADNPPKGRPSKHTFDAKQFGETETPSWMN